MKPGSFDGGFGRVESDIVVPMDRTSPRTLPVPPSSKANRSLPRRCVRSPGPPAGKVIGVGLNYRDHAGESGQPIPEVPILFPKFANSVIGPGAPIVIPSATKEPDYEAELGVVIGRTASNVSEPKALSHIGGYTCVNDVSARDLQFRSSQWMLGKAIDTFLPCGPWVVTPEEIPDPQALAIRSSIDGETLQDSTTAQMVFSVAEIAFITPTMTLEPGDLIATGTPSGVGSARTPPRWLRTGDEVTVEIEEIGRLTNPVRRP